MEDKKFSMIVPVFKTEAYLKRCLDSLLSQNYENKEIIVVLDGQSRKARKILKGYAVGKLKTIVIPHGGAPAARNAGARVATGDYFSFFSSDFEALPGMLFTWAKEFRENPDVGFVYGSYRLITPGMESSGSEEFDEYNLTQYNYIDGGFPVKREAYVPWDESIKSLQDWDWWLSIVEKGVKGKFIPDITYRAEPPRPKGLSDDSSKHWVERIQEIKKKHNIPINDICIATVGAPFHSRKMAKLLGIDIPWRIERGHPYKLIYLLGFYPEVAGNCIRLFYTNKSRSVKKVIHWIGTDVLQAHNSLPLQTMKNLAKALTTDIDLHLCEDKQNQRELAEIGIKAKILHTVDDLSTIVETPLPEKFTVAVYDPRGINSNYCPTLMDSVTRALPDVEFIYFGGDILPGYKPGNVVKVGWRPIQQIIDASSMLLRFVVHDASSFCSMEFITAGRAVLSNYQMPGVIKLKSNEQNEYAQQEIVEKIRAIKYRYPKVRGARYYRKIMNPKRLKRILEKVRDDR